MERRELVDIKLRCFSDVEAGRVLEIEALIGSITELGRLTEHSNAYHRCCLRVRGASEPNDKA